MVRIGVSIFQSWRLTQIVKRKGRSAKTSRKSKAGETKQYPASARRFTRRFFGVMNVRSRSSTMVAIASFPLLEPPVVQPSPGATRHPLPLRERERALLPSPEAGEGLGVRAVT